VAPGTIRAIEQREIQIAVSSLRLAQLAKNRRLPNPLLMYVHRYLRLTPVMAFWLLLFFKLTPHLSDGPFWQDYVHSVVDKCDGSWWSQLLYIQNFYPWDSDKVCMGWTWYLGNDFIFYAISPFLVYAYVRRASLGWLALATVLLGSLVSTWLVSSAHACGVYLLNQVEYGNYTYWLYSKPWHRLPPWLVGLATSYVWRKQEHNITCALRKTAGLSAGIMCGSLLLMLAIVLAPASDFVHGDEWSPGGTVNNLYLTFSRLLWGLACATFSVCCFAQPTAPLAAFLGASFWAPLARLTYGAYLVHPIVIKVFAGSATAFYHWNYYDLFCRWMVNSCLAYALASGAFLLVEKPFMNIEAKMFERRKPRAS